MDCNFSNYKRTDIKDVLTFLLFYLDDYRHTGEAPEDERASIVAKYELGRHDNSHIYSWEDPGFEVYHVTDRYGFLQ